MHIATTLRARLTSLIAAFLLVLAGLVGLGTRSASAATGNILPPFDIGQIWNICRGYNFASHAGTYALDLTGAGCDNSAAGRNVRAPIAGTVSYFEAEYGNLCVNVAGGGSYTLTHINPSVTSGPVTEGQVVGTVAAAAPVGVAPKNNNLAHIHFQIWGAAIVTTARSSRSMPRTVPGSVVRLT